MNKRRRARVLSLVLAVFMLFAVVPVFAPGWMGEVAAQTGVELLNVTATTSYGDHVLFRGFSGNITYILNATDAGYYINVTLLYDGVPQYSQILTPNSSLATYTIVDIPVVPKNVSTVTLVVNQIEYPYPGAPVLKTFTIPFTIKFPFTVTYTIQSSSSLAAYYWNGTAWANDKAFVGMPFDIHVVVQYNQTLVGSGVQLPDPTNLSVILANQSPVTWYDYQGATEDQGQLILKPESYNLSTGQYNFSATNIITNTPIYDGVPEKIVVEDYQNGLTNAQNEFMIYPLVMAITDVDTQPAQVFQYVPFNVTLTGQVFANISGTLHNFTVVGSTQFEGRNPHLVDSNGIPITGLMTFGFASGLVPTGGIGTAHWSNVTSNGTYFNATWAGNILFISPNPKYGSGNYYPRYATIDYPHNPIPINPWNIDISTSITCASGACTEFYVGVNQTLNISVTYPLSPYYNLSSTANYSVLLNGVEMYHGNITIVNNSGSVAIPVNFPENGTVVVKVWDPTYHPEANSVTLHAVNWEIGGFYQVFNYGWRGYPDDKFYVGIPANLRLGILYNEPCPVNTTVNITLELPNGTVLNYSTVVSDVNRTNFNVPTTFLFKEPGFVTVTYTDSLGKSYTFSIPVKDWGIFVDASPEELTQNESVNFNVFVAESLYFDWPGERDVTVTLELPDGYTVTKNLTLEANDDVYNGQGGYQGVITFVNVTPQMPGIGWVVVTDVLSNKTVKMPIVVKVPVNYVGKIIQVTATPSSTPVYAYRPNALNITIKYYDRDANGGLIPDDNNGAGHNMRIIVYDADNTVVVNTTASIPGYQYILPVQVPVNGLSPIAIEVIDLDNASLRGSTSVQVTPWNVTFNYSTDGTVWKYVDNTLKVTVHVNGPNVPVNVSINGHEYYNVVNGQTIEYPIVDPQSDLPFNVIATYNGHQVGTGIHNVTVEPWNVTFSFATNGTVWQYVDNELYVTVHVNGPNVPVNVSINGVPVGSYVNGDVIPVDIVDPQGTPTWHVEAAYNGYPVGSGDYNVTPEAWNSSISVETDGTLWEYVDNTLMVSAEPTNGVPLSANDLKVVVNTNYGSATGNGSVELPISEPIANVTGTVEVYYKSHLINSTTINIKPNEWNVTFEPVVFDWQTGMLTLYQKFNAGLNVTVHVNGPNVPVNVTFDNFFPWGTNVYDGQTLSGLGFGPLGASEFIQLSAEYKGHVVGAFNRTYYPKAWSTEVSAPNELYYLPNGYTNKNVRIGVDLAGLPDEITKAYNVTIVLNVTLPDGTIITTEANGTNETMFDLGDLTFSENGTVNYTVKVYKHDPGTGEIMISYRMGQIPVNALALDAQVTPEVAYVNVPFNLNVNVTSIAAAPNITITINGTNYTATASENGMVTIPNVVIKSPGIYNVIVHDSAINTTIVRSFEVRSWHIEVVPTPNNISAGSVYPVNFTVALMDNHGDVANITENVNLALEFSNTSVIPSGFYTWTVPVTEGHGMLSTEVFAPVAGTFQIIATDGYGNKNDTETLVVNKPNPADLTYVYVNIRKEGSLQPPGEPVKLYWGFKIGGTKKYFQVYGAQNNSDWSEAVFALYPQKPFDLYIIAVPNSTAKNYPILVEGKNYSWTTNITYVNETWPELQKNVTVTPIQGGWNIMVNVSKYEINFVNISQEIYSLHVTNVPGLIHITPGSASVQGNAIFSGISIDWYNYTNKTKTLLGSAVNETTITIEPNSLLLKLCDNTHLKPAQQGEYFTFKAMLSITNAEEQFDAQWMPFKNWITNLSFLNDTEKTDITDQILADIGNVSAINGPVSGATINFHIDNPAIAYLEPINGTTDANGTVTFKVYTKALGNMTPEQLMGLMGSVNVWATYENLTTDQITVSFGGSGSVSGDITDNTGMQIPGATITLKVWNGSAWVDATDYEGNVLTTTSATDGHYALGNVPATPEGTTYMVVATKGNLTGYAYVTVKPFATSTADVKLGGNATETGFAMYPERVSRANTVYFVFKDYSSIDYAVSVPYIASTIGNAHRVLRFASDFNTSELTSKDVVISIGGPLVNPITAAFESMAPVHMVINGSNITIVTPQGDFKWQAPKIWWNVSEGYFIIQLFEDQSGALVVTIYGTDADSTAAGAYYFMNTIYPNINDYNGINYIVGLWKDTQPEITSFREQTRETQADSVQETV